MDAFTVGLLMALCSSRYNSSTVIGWYVEPYASE